MFNFLSICAYGAVDPILSMPYEYHKQLCCDTQNFNNIIIYNKNGDINKNITDDVNKLILLLKNIPPKDLKTVVIDYIKSLYDCNITTPICLYYLIKLNHNKINQLFDDKANIIIGEMVYDYDKVLI
jgi:hypothetical protein